MLEIKAYITNLGKYNEGKLIGKWITFPIDEDDLNETLKEIGCKYYDEEKDEYFNNNYEEFFFTDFECDFDHNFSEYESIDKLNELAELLESWEDDEDKFRAAVEVFGLNETINSDFDDYILYSDIETDYDLGYYWINDSGCYDLKLFGNLANYFDYEAFGRDIRLESDGYFSKYGWIERI